MKWGVVFLVLLVSVGIMLQQAEAVEPGAITGPNFHPAGEKQENPRIVTGGKRRALFTTVYSWYLEPLTN